METRRRNTAAGVTLHHNNISHLMIKALDQSCQKNMKGTLNWTISPEILKKIRNTKTTWLLVQGLSKADPGSINRAHEIIVCPQKAIVKWVEAESSIANLIESKGNDHNQDEGLYLAETDTDFSMKAHKTTSIA